MRVLPLRRRRGASDLAPGGDAAHHVAMQAQGRRDFRQFRPHGPPTAVLDQSRVIAAARDCARLRALGLDTLAGAMAFRGPDPPVRDAGRRRTWRVAAGDGTLYVKVHDGLPWRRQFLGQLASPARAEWDNIRVLRLAGFDVPEPVAMGESSAAVGVPTQSFLVTREVAGAPLDRLLSAGWPNPRDLSPLQARLAVIQDVAGLVRRFHANGFFHRDLYLGHFIAAPDPRWGRPYLIDLARVGQGFPPRRRWLIKDLAAMESSAPATVSRADRLRFLLIYLCKSRLDPVAKRWARAILRKSARIRRHVPKFG